ncbi:site-specific integrase [Aminivibrio sp.]|uniref:tyrosine-type recombinase/integrase n=1 Tax=Aminivibrio sp. TaxID=1872489 RepID=UPI001A3ECEA1|nr:site-specific integrase [Aminivibrio sp.]MBL3539224.1 site-specific integrase [Aminivibrio sp.]
MALPSERRLSLVGTPAPLHRNGGSIYSGVPIQIDTGIRPGEALQLVSDDFHREKGEVVVRAEVAKTRTPRILPLAAPTVAAIGKLLTHRPDSWTDAPIFATETGTRLQVMSWTRRVSKYGKRCGLDITAYSLRHAAALLLLRKGADAFTVQNILGHSTMTMTQRGWLNLGAFCMLINNLFSAPLRR